MESRGTGEHSQVSTASRKCSAAREQGCGPVPVLVGLLILVLVLFYQYFQQDVLDRRKCKVLVLVLDPKYLVKIKYFSSTVEPLICIYC